ncbi:MAG TPA: HPr family phosphocarrier protein [Gemmatimonadaceae bacterium]|jgi:phosphocarrier protein|nr:HPr family phosphocarrier protein [Gemmatimonadaceae bacterium]
MMCEREVRIENRNGLHARPAAEIVKAASKFRSEITIRRDDLEVNGKSIMGVMMLAAEYGTTIFLRADGDDAEQAVEAIAALVASRFGEREA